MKTNKYALLILFASTSMIGSSAYAYESVFNFNTVYEKEIKWNDILNASLNMDFNFASELLIQKSKNENLVSNLSVKFLEKAVPKLNELLSSSKSTEEKKRDILNLIDNSFLKYTSPPSGQHGLSLKYSPSFGATKLVWNSKTINNTCDSYAGFVTKIDYNTGNFTTAWEVTTQFGKMHPDVKIYRTVNGIEAEIIKINGYIDINTYGLSDSITNNAKSLYSYYKNNRLDLQSGQETFTDFDSLNLKKETEFLIEFLATSPKEHLENVQVLSHLVALQY